MRRHVGREQLTPGQADVRRVVYAAFAATGAAPSPGALADALGRGRDEVLTALAELHGAHHLVLEPAGDAVRMAHPFSAAPMGFVLRDDGDGLWWGGCAWDSFGIVAALGRELEVLTRCPATGADLRFACGPSTPPPDGLAVRLPWEARRWWEDVVATCTRIRLFASAQDAAAEAPAESAVVPAATMWALAQGWYGDRLAPDWAPMTVEEKRALLEHHGLTGPFWAL